jgi:hypothetical protein
MLMCHELVASRGRKSPRRPVKISSAIRLASRGVTHFFFAQGCFGLSMFCTKEVTLERSLLVTPKKSTQDLTSQGGDTGSKDLFGSDTTDLEIMVVPVGDVNGAESSRWLWLP